MNGKLAACAVASGLLLAIAWGCGGGGKKTSSANRVPPKNPVQNGWVKVEGGKYKVGDKKYINFKPGTATVKTFYIQKYEVTNHQYKEWLDSLPEEERDKYTPKPDPITGKGGWSDGWYPEGLENHPVTNVTLADAMAYAKGHGWSLPNRIEWEVAARGPDARIFPWGNTLDTKKAVFKNPKGTRPVGSIEEGRSWCGAYDLAGNVWEWTTSYFDKGNSPFRLLKGGSYLDDIPELMEGASSLSAEPGKVDMTFGFRCMRKE